MNVVLAQSADEIQQAQITTLPGAKLSRRFLADAALAAFTAARI